MASNQNILTYNAKAIQVEQAYYTPVSTVQGVPVGTAYAFIGRVDPWANNTPENPLETQQYLKQTFKNMFAAKKVTTNNISPVIQRINWTTNTVYSAYSDVVDMFATDENGYLIYPFYVKNRYDQVFKCLWNNNGAPSQFEPFFQPGTYQTNNIFANAGDGYKWKYIYTIDVGSKKSFMDSNWMPVPVGANTPNPYLTSAGYGDIEVINITSGGGGYDAVNTYIVATITGDGYGATANITPQQVTNGIITDIVVSNPGTNYTNANVAINVYTSSNLAIPVIISNTATAIAPVSPVGGHGYDPLSELGCYNVMYTVEFNGSENGVIPTDPEYYQVGLLVDPSDYNSYPYPASNAIYNLATQFTVASNIGNIYQDDEVVVQVDNNNNVLFSGTVLSFDSASSVLQLINTNGSFVIGSAVKGLNSGASRTLLQISEPLMIPFSGYLAYIENRTGVQRSADGIEQFKFILGYGGL